MIVRAPPVCKTGRLKKWRTCSSTAPSLAAAARGAAEGASDTGGSSAKKTALSAVVAPAKQRAWL